ncbi:MAG: GNAT family N-acetyltransferase [Oscillospiraceae bacterium]|nr:GNAT family N-acetyltransferase [Oscillospiraceae bacterium]
MKYLPIPTLLTPHLRLRKLTMADVQAYYRHLGSSEAVTRYMLWEPHRDISQSVASIEKALRRYAEGRCYRWGIALKETDELIGVMELLRFEEETQRCSFAYMLGEAFWGQGYGTEALKAAFEFAFTQMGVKTIIADHMAENPASGRVMEKAGMQKVRFLPGKYEKNGKKYDAVEYSITASQ